MICLSVFRAEIEVVKTLLLESNPKMGVQFNDGQQAVIQAQPTLSRPIAFLNRGQIVLPREIVFLVPTLFHQ